MICRWQKLSTDKVSLKTELERLRERWRQFDIIDQTTTPRNSERGNCLRFIVPFSRVWAMAGLPRCLSRHQVNLQCAFWGVPVPHRVAVSWALGGPHLANQMRGWSSSAEEDERYRHRICNRSEVRRGR